MNTLKEDLVQIVLEVIQPVDSEVISDAFLKGSMKTVPESSSSTVGTCSVEVNVLEGYPVLLLRDWMTGHELLFQVNDDGISFAETGSTGIVEANGTVESAAELETALQQFCWVNA